MIADKKKELLEVNDTITKANTPSEDKSESKDKDQISHLEEQIRKFENQLAVQKQSSQKKQDELSAQVEKLESDCKAFESKFETETSSKAILQTQLDSMLEQQSIQALSEQFVNNIEEKANKINTERSSNNEPLKIEIEKLKAEN